MVAVAREHPPAHVSARTRDLYTCIYSHARTYTQRAWKTWIDSLFENFLDCDSNDCHLFAHFSSSSLPSYLSHPFKRRLPQISILRCGRRDNGVCVKFGGRRVKREDYYLDRGNPGWVLHLKSSDPMFMERRDGGTTIYRVRIYS